VWSLEAGRVTVWQAAPAAITAAAFSSDGRLVAVGLHTGAVALFVTACVALFVVGPPAEGTR
jgi:hypothetical protein